MSDEQAVPDNGSETESPSVIAARDELLYAIADEVARVSGSQPGNASGALVELARAYALVTKGRESLTLWVGESEANVRDLFANPH